MFRKRKFKMPMIMLLAVIFTMSLFTTVVEAKGPSGGGTTSNKAPVITQGASISITTDEDTATTVILDATDANRDNLSWSISSSAGNGAITFGIPSGSRGKSQVPVTYKPNQNYTGSDSFVVEVKDVNGGTDSITIGVTINPINDAPVVTINYVALGDSIATGTIYPGKQITTYVSYFYEFLKSQNTNAQVNLKSFATDGDRTNELYNKLGLGLATAANTELINAVKSASIITISIGGNNLMRAAKEDSGLYDFENVNTVVAEQGVTDFNAQWVPIIEKIKSLNSNTKIIVATIFNPYNELDATLHNTVHSYLFRTDNTGINDVIRNKATLGYVIADVYKAFYDDYKNNMGAITYFYPSSYDLWGQLTRNPHPNAAGQSIITNLHKAAYQLIN